jgi:NADH-quinone oxidoreductase subunit J
MGDSPLHVVCFYLFAALAVIPTAMILATKDVVRAAFLLLGSLAGVAGLYGVLGADFVCFVQVLVYIGGILILLLFGVMLTNREPILIHRLPTHGLLIPGFFASLAFFLALLYVTFGVDWKVAMTPNKPTSADLGDLLMTDFLLPFEASSVLLLVALVGAAAIARRRGDTSEPD